MPDALLDVPFPGHFGADFQSVPFPGFLQPGESWRADALKASRVGAGLPDAGPEYVDAGCGKFPGRLQHLLFALCGAGTGDDHGVILLENAPFGDGDQIEFIHGHGR